MCLEFPYFPLLIFPNFPQLISPHIIYFSSPHLLSLIPLSIPWFPLTFSASPRFPVLPLPSFPSFRYFPTLRRIIYPLYKKYDGRINGHTIETIRVSAGLRNPKNEQSHVRVNLEALGLFWKKYIKISWKLNYPSILFEFSYNKEINIYFSNVTP